jgi:3-hydroxybutyryl-CoA dehydrogenase
MDAVGLDLAGAVVDYVTRDLSNKVGAPEILEEKVRNGQLGAASGRGFYDWSVKSLSEVKQRRDQFIVDFLKRYREV